MSYNQSGLVLSSLDKKFVLLYNENIQWRVSSDKHYLGISYHKGKGYYVLSKVYKGVLDIIEIGDILDLKSTVENLTLKYYIMSGKAKVQKENVYIFVPYKNIQRRKQINERLISEFLLKIYEMYDGALLSNIKSSGEAYLIKLLLNSFNYLERNNKETYSKQMFEAFYLMWEAYEQS